MNLYTELKRRNVFRVAAAYIVVGWLIMQVAEILIPALRLPEWVLTATLYFLFVGFLPALVFAWAFELTPEGIRKEKEVDRDESITHVTGRKLDFAIIGLLAIAVIYLLFDKLGPEKAEDSDTTQAVQAEESQAAAPPAKSIAVLPFANMSEDASNEYFSDGIAEEILNELAQIDELKVAGRTSSFAFKGRNEDLRLIGETLDVSHILEGSVRKAGNTVRITAQLISVQDGYHLWSETYDRELTDIFAIQDEIAAAILGELKAELVGEERIGSTRTDPRAYEKYLQAKQLMYTRSRPELEEAGSLLAEALELDDQFAPAWAQRGILAMLLSATQYGTIPFADSQAQARRYLERALELDDELAEAWAGLGLNHANEGGTENTRLAREYLERALAINPALVDASNWLYAVLNDEGRAAEAVAVMEDIFERDPLYPPVLGNLQLAYMVRNRKTELGPLLDRVRPFLEGSVTFNYVQASHLASLGEHAEALPFARYAYEEAPENFFAAHTLARNLMFLNKFDTLADFSYQGAWPRNLALLYLERPEEATVLSRNFFRASGNPQILVQTLAHSGQHDALLRFIESGWGDLEGFYSAHPGDLGFGDLPLLHIAWAGRQSNRPEIFREAMRLARQSHDQQREAGINWQYFNLAEAHYWTLANDQERAIDALAAASEQGMILAPRISRLYPLLKPLEGHPRFEAVQQEMLHHLNRERVEAGLEPLEKAYEL